MTLRTLLEEGLREERAKLQELQGQLREVQANARVVEQRIEHMEALLQSELRPDAEVTQSPEVEWISVREAIDDMLKQGPLSTAELRRRLPREYPIDVKSIGKSVAVALSRGCQIGAYEWVERGVYKLKER